MTENLARGMSVAFSLSALSFCFLGVALGIKIGVLLGIGPLATVGMLLPLTFYAPPTEAIIMLAGIWCGSMYGGSTAAILLSLPGIAGAAVTTIDGYPMAQQGRAGVALLFSFVGYLMRLARLFPAPLLLVLVLGPILEQNLRHSLLLAHGDPMTFLERPISAGVLTVGLVMVIAIFWMSLRKPKRPKTPQEKILRRTPSWTNYS